MEKHRARGTSMMLGAASHLEARHAKHLVGVEAEVQLRRVAQAHTRTNDRVTWRVGALVQLDLQLGEP